MVGFSFAPPPPLTGLPAFAISHNRNPAPDYVGRICGPRSGITLVSSSDSQIQNMIQDFLKIGDPKGYRDDKEDKWSPHEGIWTE